MIAPDVVAWLQCLIGAAIVVGGVVIQAAGSDHRTPLIVQLLSTGLVGWGAWFAVLGYEGKADSPPSLAFGAAIAYILIVRGRQIRGIVEGETWWPPNAGIYSVHMSARRKAAKWSTKINPVWALFGNADDGVLGPPWYLHPTFLWIPESIGWRWWRAVCWWFRNPAHNLTFYIIGVADVDRMVSSRWGADIHPPVGGLHFMWTMAPVQLWRGKQVVISLPFVSYLSEHVKAYAGWRPSGAFGFKANISIAGRPEWLAR
jgi:hypothetical protein